MEKTERKNAVMKKTLSLLLSLLLLFPLATEVKAYSFAAPVEPDLWVEPDFHTDHAYSIAFVGDTQYLSRGDALHGTHTMDQLYGILADTAEERKLKQVFILGDITDNGYHNDANLATSYWDPPQTGEWEVSQKAILKLSQAGISYSICRGNHDDYMIDDYFNIPAYTDQFKGCGGFFSDSAAKHPERREEDNPDGYVYWSALTGYHENTIVNSYRTAEICGTKYLFITVDFNPTLKVVRWLNQILTDYSDHLAIVTTHSYIGNNGDLRTSEKGDTKYPFGYTADKIWDMALASHENLLMVVSGHVPTKKPVHSYRRGDHGNIVRNILVDPQRYDVKEDADGNALQGTQDTGMILYMNFSQDGSVVSFDYYSTLLNKEMAETDETLTLYQRNPTLPEEEEEEPQEAEKEEPEEEEPPPETKEEPKLEGRSPLTPAFLIACATGLLVILIPVLWLLLRKKKPKNK
jgi:hypothetical protein